MGQRSVYTLLSLFQPQLLFHRQGHTPSVGLHTSFSVSAQTAHLQGHTECGFTHFFLCFRPNCSSADKDTQSIGLHNPFSVSAPTALSQTRTHRVCIYTRLSLFQPQLIFHRQGHTPSVGLHTSFSVSAPTALSQTKTHRVWDSSVFTQHRKGSPSLWRFR